MAAAARTTASPDQRRAASGRGQRQAGPGQVELCNVIAALLAVIADARRARPYTGVAPVGTTTTGGVAAASTLLGRSTSEATRQVGCGPPRLSAFGTLLGLAQALKEGCSKAYEVPYR